MKHKKIAMSDLTDLALGKASHDEALRLLDELDKDENASREFEFVLDVLTYVKAEGNDLVDSALPRRIPYRLGFGAMTKGVLQSILHGPFAFPSFAVCILLLLAVARWETGHERSYLNQYESQLIDLVDVRGVEPGQFSHLDELLAKREYLGAIAFLEHSLRVHPNIPENDQVEFELAMCYVQAGKSRALGALDKVDASLTQHAIALLDHVIATSGHKYLIVRAHWARVLVLFSEGKNEEAAESLRIVIESNTEFSIEAKSLVTRLTRR